MDLGEIKFIGSVGDASALPPEDLPEIAFAGRSNVGKSSLVNTLLHRKALLKVSSEPGRTRTLNFIDIGGRLRFVDLPGYGYAKVSKSLRSQWGKLIERYLSERPNLAAVTVILDIRRKPSGEDLELLDWLAERECPTVLAITKSDKLPLQQRKRALIDIAAELDLDVDALFPFSAEKGWGRQELLKTLLELGRAG